MTIVQGLVLFGALFAAGIVGGVVVRYVQRIKDVA